MERINVVSCWGFLVVGCFLMLCCVLYCSILGFLKERLFFFYFVHIILVSLMGLGMSIFSVDLLNMISVSVGVVFVGIGVVLYEVVF